MKPNPRRVARRTLGVLTVLLSALALLSPRGARGQAPDDLLAKLRYPKTVLLLRHAEKAADDPRDPSLSEAGVARAQELARVLGDAGVTHLYSSEFRRTRDTLAPLSLVAGVDVQVVPARDPEALVSAVSNLPRGSVAVVAGHSNTVPGLVRLLAPEREAFELAESDYDRLYAVTLTGPHSRAAVLELRFGAAD